MHATPIGLILSLIDSDTTADIYLGLQAELVDYECVRTVRQYVVDLQDPLAAVPPHPVSSPGNRRIPVRVVCAHALRNDLVPSTPTRSAGRWIHAPAVVPAAVLRIGRLIADEAAHTDPVAPLIADVHQVVAEVTPFQPQLAADELMFATLALTVFPPTVLPHTVLAETALAERCRLSSHPRHRLARSRYLLSSDDQRPVRAHRSVGTVTVVDRTTDIKAVPCRQFQRLARHVSDVLDVLVVGVHRSRQWQRAVAAVIRRVAVRAETVYRKNNPCPVTHRVGGRPLPAKPRDGRRRTIGRIANWLPPADASAPAPAMSGVPSFISGWVGYNCDAM